MKKYVFRFLIVLLTAVLIEVVCFQGISILRLLNAGYGANQELGLGDCETANWEQQPDGSLLSGTDPILVIAGLNREIHQLEIHATASAQVPYAEVFYVNGDHLQFGEIVLRGEAEGENWFHIDVGDFVQDLRLDLGDDAGVVLYDLAVRINPVSVRISPARIVAVIFIYWSGALLFSLQKTPNYKLQNGHRRGESNET